MLTKKQFELIFSLQVKQPWLTKRSDCLITLLTEECSSSEQQQLILNLLNNFTHITGKVYGDILEGIVKDITTNYSEENTIIVAMAIGGSPDSSQHVIYQMKPSFEYYGWRQPFIINNIDKIIREINKAKKNRDLKIKNIVVVDEFIGSGSTVEGRYNKISRECFKPHKNTFKDCKIKFYSIASTSSGYDYVNRLNIDCSVKHLLKKGISDYEENKDDKLKLMKDLEGILSSSYKGRDLPSLGYGKVEALYSRDRGNTPNNVFPIFWWSIYKNKENRKTILTRLMGEA